MRWFFFCLLCLQASCCRVVLLQPSPRVRPAFALRGPPSHATARFRYCRWLAEAQRACEAHSGYEAITLAGMQLLLRLELGAITTEVVMTALQFRSAYQGVLNHCMPREGSSRSDPSPSGSAQNL